MLDRIVNRRRFIQISVSASATAFLAGCNFEPPPPPKPANKFEHIFKADKNKDGIFRASTLTFYTPLFGFVGHGFIVEQTDNRLYICTVAHVAEALFADNCEVFIPGVGVKYVSEDGFDYHGQKDDFEAAAFHPLRTDTTEQIRRLERQGGFTPLRAASSYGRANERCVIPRTDLGNFKNYTLTNHVERGDLYRFEGVDSNVICAGQSGSPILKAPNSRVTREFIGMLSLARKEPTQDPHGLFDRCSRTFYARSNNYLGTQYANTP